MSETRWPPQPNQNRAAIAGMRPMPSVAPRRLDHRGIPLDLPTRPRAWRRSLSYQGALVLGALAWFSSGAVALLGTAWAIHWIFGG